MAKDIRTDFTTPEPVTPPKKANKLRVRSFVGDFPEQAGATNTVRYAPQVVEITEDGSTTPAARPEWCPGERVIPNDVLERTTVADLGLDATATVPEVVAAFLISDALTMYPAHYQDVIEREDREMSRIDRDLTEQTELRDEEQAILDEWLAKKADLEDPDQDDPAEDADFIAERIAHFTGQVKIFQDRVDDLTVAKSAANGRKSAAARAITDNPFAIR